MKIYSVHFNKPEYIELQKKSFEKYIKFDYEFIIVNNAVDFNIKNSINEAANSLSLRVIDCNNYMFGMSSVSHQNSFKYILNEVQDGDTLMIVDHDVFTMNDLHKSYFEDYDLVFLPQPRGHIEYPWPGMIIFNSIKNKSEVSFDSGVIEGESCDTGAKMYHYIKNNSFRIKKLSETYPMIGKNLMSNIDNIFIHLVSGSGWNIDYDLENKLKVLKEKIKI